MAICCMAGDLAPAAARPWLRWSMRLGLAGLSFVLALAVGEGIARVAARAAGEPHDAWRARAEVWDAVHGMGADLSAGRVVIPSEQGTSRVMLHPYLGFDGASGLEQVEADLARAHTPERAREFQVLLLGGSVASITAMESEPLWLARLRADPRLAERDVRLLVYARGAFKQPQQVNLLTYLLALGIVPDAVVNIDGYNELAMNADAFPRGLHPIQPQIAFWGSVLASVASSDSAADRLRGEAIALLQRGRRVTDVFEGLRLHHSALACWAMRAWGSRLRAELFEVQTRYAERLTAVGQGADPGATRVFRGPRLPDGERPLDACVRSWSESSRNLRALCESRGIPYLHLLQPTLHDEGSKPLTDEERASCALSAGSTAMVRQGYPLLRERGQGLAAEGEHFVDASRLFAEERETLYYDACHFKGRGTDLLATLAAEELLALLP